MNNMSRNTAAGQRDCSRLVPDSFPPCALALEQRMWVSSPHRNSVSRGAVA